MVEAQVWAIFSQNDYSTVIEMFQLFDADSSGIIDATAALQKAIDYAYDCNLVVFFPEGTYRVSGQLRMIHKQPPSGTPYSQTKFVHKLVGATRSAQRPVIRLTDQSTVTDSILMLFRYEFLDGSTDSSRHYAAELRNIDIDMGMDMDMDMDMKMETEMNMKMERGTKMTMKGR